MEGLIGKITVYSYSEFESDMLVFMLFNETKRQNISNGKEETIFRGPGGYPLLSLKVKDGYLYLQARLVAF